MNSSTHRADWLHTAGWGVFCHYLADKASAAQAVDISVEKWNARVESFDVERLARQLDQVGAKYFMLTIGQNSGYFCAPNTTYDAIVGRQPSRCSERDLIGDVADALAAKGIRTIVYTASGAPQNDTLACEKFHWKFIPPSPASSQDIPREGRLLEFEGLWTRVLEDWALRWGEKISGWWLDGVWSGDQGADPNFTALSAALRAGNPEAIVAHNAGVKMPRIIALPGTGEDYTAGEVDFALPVPGRWYDGTPAWPGRLIQSEQFHLLTFLGEWWGDGQPRFSTLFVKAYTEMVISKGGAITWDVPITEDGAIHEPFLQQLAALKR